MTPAAKDKLTTSPPLTQATLVAGIIFFAIMVSLQLYYSDLRVLIDGSVSTFIIAADKWFDVAEQRYLIGLNQVFPVIAANLNLGVKHIVASYLLNDVIIYPVVFLLLLFPLRDPRSALALIIGYMAVANYHFFIITYSLLLGWPLVLLFFSIYRHQQFEISIWTWRFFTLLVLAYFIVYAHPILVVTFGFLWLHHFFNGTSAQKKNLLYPAAFAFLLFAFKWLKPDPYDVGQAQAFDLYAYQSIDPHILRMHLKTFLFYPTYTISVVLAIGLIFKWLKNKQWQLTIAPTLGLTFLVLVYTVYGIYSKYPFGPWMPNAIAAPCFLLVVVLIDWYWPTLAAARLVTKRLLLAALVVLMVGEFGVIIHWVSDTFRERKAAIHTILEQVPDEEWSKYALIMDINADNYFYKLVTPSEIMVASERFYERTYTPNVVVLDDSVANQLDDFWDDLVYVNQHRWFPVEDCEPAFHFKEGPFKKIYAREL